ncbi:MAG: hypothetical protein R2867_21110 [Caldilineaceae bacterium]
MENGRKRIFPTAEIFLSHGYHWQQVVRISEKELTALPDGVPMAFRDGTLIRGSGYTIFVVEKGLKRPFLEADDFQGMGYRWENIIQIPDEQLNALFMGPALVRGNRYPAGTLLQSNGQTVYLLCDGKRCPFPSVQVFQSWGFRWEDIINVAEEELVRYPLGKPILAQKSMFHNWRNLQTQTLNFINESSVTAVHA